MIIWVVVAVLAGVTLGALFVLVTGEGSLLTLGGLRNPVLELKRPPDNIPQALLRLPWALGFAILQTLLWGFAILGFLGSTYGSATAAVFAAIIGVVVLVGSRLIPSVLNPTTTDIWQAWSLIAYAASYGLSVCVGRDLAGKKEE